MGAPLDSAINQHTVHKKENKRGMENTLMVVGIQDIVQDSHVMTTEVLLSKNKSLGNCRVSRRVFFANRVQVEKGT